jgi:predicted regulator of Ras-like GTPase activity (Roadblock/LC7/MglB family)
MTQVGTADQLNWLLDDLVTRVDQVRQAVILSRDGLTIGTSRWIGEEDAEHMSAMAAALLSLAHGASQTFEGGLVRQTIIEMDSAFLFVVVAGTGTCLAVLTTENANAGLIAYEMTMLVKRVRRQIGTSFRSIRDDAGPSSAQL